MSDHPFTVEGEGTGDFAHDLTKEIARQCVAIVERRARFIMANPPVAVGFHRHAKRITRQDCECKGSSVITKLDGLIYNLRECSCTQWVTRDFPDGQCPECAPFLVVLSVP